MAEKIKTKNLIPRAIGFPYKRNINFYGRKNEFESITKILKNDSVLVITGIVGIGKPEVVVNYALSMLDNFDYCLWINAENKQAMDCL